MKASRILTTAGLITWMCGAALAGSPPLDRPTPPPYCADGHAFASPAIYGVFPTHWRRWPLECGEEPTPTAPSTTKATPLPRGLENDVKPYETPTKEQEERRAPAPTAPLTEQNKNEQPPGTGGPGTPSRPQGSTPSLPGNVPAGVPRLGPGYPTPGLPTPPQTAPNLQPGGTTPPTSTPPTSPLFKNIPANSPLNRSGAMNDDPPPALPFASPPVAEEAPNRAVQNAVYTTAAPSATPPAETSSNDPPPAPPVSLASYEN